MLYYTKGIVFHQVKYSETSIITRIYTEQFGLQSYIIRGVRNKKSQIKPALLQPLTLVDMVVYHKENRDIQHLREIRISYSFKSIPFDIRKSSVLLFLNEILYNVIREQEPNPGLFEYLTRSIITLDTIENDIADFHLYFLMRLTKFLGFFPKANFSEENPVFDLQEGVFVSSAVAHKNFLLQPYSGYFALLLNPGEPELSITPLSRPILLDFILQYFRTHIPDFKEIKSHAVLHTVLNA